MKKFKEKHTKIALKDKHLTKTTKTEIYKTLESPSIIYGGETTTMAKKLQDLKRIEINTNNDTRTKERSINMRCRKCK